MRRQSAADLDALPEGLEFPHGLRDRISYDPVQNLLVFRGFMSSADYYFLRECSDDPAYLSVLEELHRASDFQKIRQKWGRGTFTEKTKRPPRVRSSVTMKGDLQRAIRPMSAQGFQ